MKHCPQCNRDYFDDTLSFCLEDGTRLVAAGSGSPGDAATVALPALEFHNAGTITGVGPSFDLSAIPNNAIAVMPFANMSRDEDIEYFSDGLAEELLNVLSKIAGLRVAARSSAFSFKGKPASISEIGQTLNVASVLEGSIRVSGERTRISVRLVKVSDGYQLWSETYDRKMDDIFAIQDDIARSVVEEIRTRLLDESLQPSTERRIASEVAEAGKGRASVPEAQRLMLLGRYFLDRTTREDTVKAIGYFRDALEIDPNFAFCWAELARAFAIEAGHAWIPISEGFARARDAATRALSIEPNLAEAYAQLGRVHAAYSRDFASAEESYKRALELAPGSALVLDGASILAYKLGRIDEAIELNRQVLERDPLSAAFWHNLGLAAHAGGNLQESAMAYRRALEIVPHRFVSRALLALVLLEQGNEEEAIEQAKAESDEFWSFWSLAIIHYTLGNTETADKLFEKVLELSEGTAYQIAEVYSVRNMADEAFEWLYRADKEMDPGILHAKVNPRFRGLHKDPRWEPLLTKIGFDSEISGSSAKS